MHVLVMLTILDKHLLSSIIDLRYLQEIQFGPGMDVLLYFTIAFLNFFFEKIGHSKGGFERILSNSCKLT